MQIDTGVLFFVANIVIVGIGGYVIRGAMDDIKLSKTEIEKLKGQNAVLEERLKSIQTLIEMQYKIIRETLNDIRKN